MKLQPICCHSSIWPDPGERRSSFNPSLASNPPRPRSLQHGALRTLRLDPLATRTRRHTRLRRRSRRHGAPQPQQARLCLQLRPRLTSPARPPARMAELPARDNRHGREHCLAQGPARASAARPQGPPEPCRFVFALPFVGLLCLCLCLPCIRKRLLTLPSSFPRLSSGMGCDD